MYTGRVVRQLGLYVPSFSEKFNDADLVGRICGNAILSGVVRFTLRQDPISRKNAADVEPSDIYKTFEMFEKAVFASEPANPELALSGLEQYVGENLLSKLRSSQTIDPKHSRIMPAILETLSKSANHSDIIRRFGKAIPIEVGTQLYSSDVTAKYKDTQAILHALAIARGDSS